MVAVQATTFKMTAGVELQRLRQGIAHAHLNATLQLSLDPHTVHYLTHIMNGNIICDRHRAGLGIHPDAGHMHAVRAGYMVGRVGRHAEDLVLGYALCVVDHLRKRNPLAGRVNGTALL